MEKETGRIEAFSDGIFAVAITLLALEIGIDVKDLDKGISNEELLQKILSLWPKYLAYFNSFAAVLLMWMSHHQLFKLLRKTNNKLQLVNGVLLLFVALVPFPTKTLGEFIDTPAKNTAILFYAGYSILISSAFLLLGLCIRAQKSNLLPHVQPAMIDGIVKGLAVGVACYVLITLLAFIIPDIALLLTFGMWIFWAVYIARKDKDL